ncbi:MAG TPA: hypothetical protein PKY81_12270 [bacterium]|nr:hypothetical protein [bacterium]
MGDGSQKALIITILGSILIGLIVIAFNKNYRPETISITNKKFYPTIETLSKNNSEYDDKLSGGDE